MYIGAVGAGRPLRWIYRAGDFSCGWVSGQGLMWGLPPCAARFFLLAKPRWRILRIQRRLGFRSLLRRFRVFLWSPWVGCWSPTPDTSIGAYFSGISCGGFVLWLIVGRSGTSRSIPLRGVLYDPVSGGYLLIPPGPALDLMDLHPHTTSFLGFRAVVSCYPWACPGWLLVAKPQGATEKS